MFYRVVGIVATLLVSISVALPPETYDYSGYKLFRVDAHTGNFTKENGGLRA